MNKTSDKEKLNEAVKLLESLYNRVKTGCSYDGKNLYMHPCLISQQQIFDLVKSVKPETKLERPIIKPYIPTLA